jgi:hypothetical protein
MNKMANDSHETRRNATTTTTAAADPTQRFSSMLKMKDDAQALKRPGSARGCAASSCF